MANQLKEELILEHGQFDSSINKVIQKVEELKKKGNGAGQGFTQSMNGMISSCKNFNGSLNSLLGVVGKFGWQLGVAAVAVKGFSEVIKRNDTIGDEWARTMAAAKSSYETFMNALAKGDFTNFIENLRSATKEARDAADAIDELETTKTFNSFRLQELQTAYQKALILSRDRNISEKERLKYLNEAKRILIEQNKLLQIQMSLLRNSANKKMNQLLSENGLSALVGNEGMQKWYMNNQGNLQAYVAKVDKEMAKARKKYGVLNPNSSTRGYDKWKEQNKAMLERQARAKNFLNMIETHGEEIASILADIQEADALDLQMTQNKYEVDTSEYKLNKQMGADAKKNIPVYRKEAKTIEELKENVKALTKERDKSKDKKRIEEINKELDETARKIKSLETGSVNKMAKSTGEIQKNIQILSDKLQYLDPNSEEFAKTTKELNEWKDKLDDIDTAAKKVGVDLSSNDPRQIRRNIEYYSKMAETSPDREVREHAKRIVQQQQSGENVNPKYTAAWYQKEIELKKQQLALLVDENFAYDKKRKLIEDIFQLQQKLNSITDDAYVKAPPINAEQERLQRTHNNAQQGIASVLDLRSKGVLSHDEAQKWADDINAQLKALNLEPIKVHIETDIEKSLASIQEDASVIYGAFEGMDSLVNSFDRLSTSINDGANAWTIFMNILQTGMETLQAISSVISMITFLQDLMNTSNTVAAMATQEAAVAESEKMGTDVAAAATAEATALSFKMQEKALLNLASSSIFAAHANIPFAGVPIAQGYVNEMMAQMTVIHALTTALTAYANGGIIGGNSYAGDSVLVRANSGEMLLNGSQQKHLFDLLDRGAVGNSYGGAVEFKLRGSDLYGAMKNYSSIKSKTSDITRFK